MRLGGILFAYGCAFYFIVAGVYAYMSHDPVGTTVIALTGGLAFLVAFYVLFTAKRVGDLPEDNPNANISDADAEYGFFSPHSWWPLPVALSACATGLGLLMGWWLTTIAIGALFVSIFGFVLEYEKPSASTH